MQRNELSTARSSDQRFVLDHVVRIGELAANRRGHGRCGAEGAAAFAEGEFAPLDRIGDTLGARWDDGVVTHAAGFRDGLCRFRRRRLDDACRRREAHGGQGLPLSLPPA